MKILLGLSLLANVILGILYSQKRAGPPLEKIVMETHTPKEEKVAAIIETKEDPDLVKLPSTGDKTIPTEDNAPAVDENTMKAVEEVSEKVKNDRTNFLTEKLDLGQHELDQIEKIKQRFYNRMNKIAPNGGDLSIEQRRKFLELETLRDQELAKQIGQKKWERFQKFKKDYNKKMFQEQTGEYNVVVPLDI